MVGVAGSDELLGPRGFRGSEAIFKEPGLTADALGTGVASILMNRRAGSA